MIILVTKEIFLADPNKDRIREICGSDPERVITYEDLGSLLASSRHAQHEVFIASGFASEMRRFHLTPR